MDYFSVCVDQVQLGLLPGAGGTQRLPKLVGIQRFKGCVLPMTEDQVRTFSQTARNKHVLDDDPGSCKFQATSK